MTVTAAACAEVEALGLRVQWVPSNRACRTRAERDRAGLTDAVKAEREGRGRRAFKQT
jgi:hypothetical protein